MPKPTGCPEHVDATLTKRLLEARVAIGSETLNPLDAALDARLCDLRISEQYAGGVFSPVGRSTRTHVHSRPVLVLPHSTTRTGTCASSACISIRPLLDLDGGAHGQGEGRGNDAERHPCAGGAQAAKEKARRVAAKLREMRLTRAAVRSIL